ncbi:MAG TPA: SDR family oxidoreductase [Solirubrobacterales bacterium]|jgi:NADP-dependent 3-hydroxy acid dehydrogenase YdfG
MPGSSADDPVLLISGASSGIGAATARAAGERYRLVLAARRIKELDVISGELGGTERALPVRCDVTEWDQVEKMVARALEQFGRIDAVFVNAGFGAKRGFLEESVEHWRSMVLTNVLGPALTIRATLPHLLERGSGHYVITSSVAGRLVLPGSLYSATKWAATSIGNNLRAELRQIHENEAIRVTLIEPGVVDTPFFEDRPDEGSLRDEDIAGAVLWALGQPPNVDVNEILLRPTKQPG